MLFWSRTRPEAVTPSLGSFSPKLPAMVRLFRASGQEIRIDTVVVGWIVQDLMDLAWETCGIPVYLQRIMKGCNQLAPCVLLAASMDDVHEDLSLLMIAVDRHD